MSTTYSKPGKKRIFTSPVDYELILIVVILLALGLVMLYSASFYEAGNSAASNYDSAYYLKKQGLWTVLSFIVMVIMSFVPYKVYDYLALPGMVISFLLVAACLTAEEINGARRWLNFGPINLQPAEVVKVEIIILMAMLIVRLGRSVRTAKSTFFLMAFPTALALELLLITRNLSSAFIVFAIAFAMLFIARPDYGPFLVFVGVGMAALVGLILWIDHNYTSAGALGANFRGRRVVAWLHPEDFAQAEALQPIQALYAIGSGGMLGKGLGQSMQKLGYIPEVQNDMIFSVVCEELGVVGGIIIIALYVLLCYRILRVASQARDAYGAFLATGVFIHIALQVLINISVATSVIPNTGVGLPFISYGGSSILFTMAEIGMVLNVSRRRRAPESGGAAV